MLFWALFLSLFLFTISLMEQINICFSAASVHILQFILVYLYICNCEYIFVISHVLVNAHNCCDIHKFDDEYTQFCFILNLANEITLIWINLISETDDQYIIRFHDKWLSGWLNQTPFDYDIRICIQ